MANTKYKKPTPGQYSAADLFRMNTPITSVSQDESGSQLYKVLDVEKIDHFKNHPFKIRENQELEDLTESVRTYGVLTPILVRPKLDCDHYEVLSGHNRLEAAKKAGLSQIPGIIITDIEDDDAAMVVLETNAQQRSFSDLSYSERAKSIAMQYEIMKRKKYRRDIIDKLVEMENGEPTSSIGSASATGNIYQLSKGAVFLYLRVATLTDTLLALVDEGQITLKAGEVISYLPKYTQNILVDQLNKTGFQLNEKKAQALKKNRNDLTEDAIRKILDESFFKKKKAGDPPIRIQASTWKDYFPQGTTSEEASETIQMLLDKWANSWLPRLEASSPKEAAEKITQILTDNL